MKPGGERSGGDDGRPRSAGWEVIDDEDVIGTASARLLSTCADRSDRLAALSLLGLLLDHADEAGRIRLALDTLAHELDVDPERVVRLLQRLVTVEAVRTEGDAVVVVGSHSTDAPLRPSRFLANLVAVLEREPSLEAAGATSRIARTTGAMAPRPQVATKRRVLVALGVGLAAMVLTTTPSGDPRTTLRSVSAPADLRDPAPSSTQPAPGNAPAATPAAPGQSQPAPENPGFAAEVPSPSAPDAGKRANGASEPVEPQSDFPGDRPVVRSEVPRPAPTPPRPEAGAAEPGRPLPAPEQASGAPAPPTEPPDEGRTCPSGVPEAAVSAIQVLGVWPGSILDPVDERVLQVTGTVTNNLEEAITIETIEVGTGEGTDRVVAVAGPAPFTIVPGATADWEAELVTGSSPVADPLADVRVLRWSWADPDLDGCST